MSEDDEGFLYPQADVATCIDCGLCEKVCPIINQNEPKEPLAVYAAQTTNEEMRLKSSSGGIFTLLATRILDEGGVVFGAKFDKNWNVVHDHTATIEGLADFRGSKYVQSFIGDNFVKAKQFLEQSRKVLFSGTPCQIAGLKKFLRKEYENLLTVEVVCHGVPSPLVWRDYLDFKRAKHVGEKSTSDNELPVITNVSFRDKTYGWKNFGVKICYTDSCETTPFEKDLFMKGFLKNLYLRPSCYHCAARQGKSGADISIADFWEVQSIHSQIDDDKGTSAVIINTEGGNNSFSLIKNQIKSVVSSHDNAIRNNPCIVESVKEPAHRQQFWQSYLSLKIKSIEKICDLDKPSPIVAFAKKVARKIKSKILRE